MYHLLIRNSASLFSNSSSAPYCIYGNGYRSSWWSYTVKDAIENYLSKKDSSCVGTLEECIIEGQNKIIHILPFEVLDANYIIDHHPEFFI